MNNTSTVAPNDKLDVAYIVLERTGGIVAKAKVNSVQAANYVLLQWARTLSSANCEVCKIHIHFEDGFACQTCYTINAAKKSVSLAREIRDPMFSLSVSSMARGCGDQSNGTEYAVPINGFGETLRTVLDRYDI